MSKRTTDDLGNEIIFIAPEDNTVCELCGVTEETRPYGPNGERICWACGEKDPQSRDKMMGVVLFGDTK